MVGRVHEFGIEELGHQPGAEVLAPGHGELPRAAGLEFTAEGLQRFGQSRVQTEFVGNAKETIGDQTERLVNGRGHGRHVVAEIEQVGDLGLVRPPFARRGHDKDAAARVGLHDGGDLAELGGIGNARPAELGDYSLHGFILLAMFCW